MEYHSRSNYMSYVSDEQFLHFNINRAPVSGYVRAENIKIKLTTYTFVRTYNRIKMIRIYYSRNYI